LEILVNVGGDLTEKSVKELAELGADTICCNLETINEDVFYQRKPGDSLDQRILTCKRVSDAGVGLSSGLLLGLGESKEDRIRHLRYLSNFKTLEEIPIMGFNPYEGTPMADWPAFPLIEQLKMVAVTRIMYPEITITMPTPTVGPENVEFSLKAGANNLATVIADNYPHEVKGVGSPNYGNYSEVVNVIEKLDLIPQTI
jgi:biotin synthase